MKKRLITMLLVALTAISSVFALVACNKDGPEPEPGPTEYTAPVITVKPAEMELTQGTPEEEYSLLFGVTVTDEYDSNLKATIKDDGGFDIDEVGNYTVTYSATNSKGKEGTATRIYHVVAPLPSLILEAQQENDKASWVDKLGHAERLLTFKHEEYIELTEDIAYAVSTKGVFHNKSNAAITLSVAGTHGESAVLDSTGVVIEARDGANGRLVNKDNPVRTGSGVTSLPEEWFADLEPEEGVTPNYTVSNNYAFHLVIPADGFAVVVPNTGNFDEDGRGWLNKNVVYQYGAAVKLYFEPEVGEDPEYLTGAYVNHAPVVLTKPNVVVRQGDGTTKEQVEELLLQDITYVDDNGTWETADDVKTGLTITVIGQPDPEYDNDTLGTYRYTLRISDGTQATEFYRDVIVREPAATMPTISVDGKWFEYAENKVIVNPEPTITPTAYDLIIYTSYVSVDYVVNNYAPYFVVDAAGKVVASYHPSTQKIYTRGEGNAVVETTKANTNVLSGVEIPAGGYVVLGVYPNAGNNDFRPRIADDANKMLGATVELMLIDWMPTLTVTKENGTSASHSGNKIIVNADGAKAAQQAFLVYTKDYKAEKLNVNGWGLAVVINEDGEIIKIYDAVNGKYTDAENEGVGAAGFFAAGTYAQDAFDALEEGEILVVFPNDGTNGPDSSRTFGMNNARTLGSVITFKNFKQPWVEEEVKKMIKFGSALVEVGDIAIDKDNATTEDGFILIYTKAFEGTLIEDSKGDAVVVKDGKIVRVYDGRNAKYYDAENAGGIQDASKCTADGYLTEAFASLEEGEYIVVFVYANNAEGNQVTFAQQNCRTIDKTVELVNFTLE